MNTNIDFYCKKKNESKVKLKLTFKSEYCPYSD